MGLLSRWSGWNKKVCDAVEDRLPEAFTRSLSYLNDLIVAEIMQAHPGALLLDVGAGGRTPVASRRTPKTDSWLLGSDISEGLLRENHGLDARVVADACVGLPLKRECVDIVTARCVMEHLPDNARFLLECRRVLKRGGIAVCVMPGRRAPFALLNRILPEALKRRLLFAFFPEWQDACGFRAHYDRCAWPQMGETFAAAGLHIERVELRYYQSIYFKMFAPLYLLLVIYDLLLWSLSMRRLCCQMLIVARRI